MTESLDSYHKYRKTLTNHSTNSAGLIHAKEDTLLAIVPVITNITRETSSFYSWIGNLLEQNRQLFPYLDQYFDIEIGMNAFIQNCGFHRLHVSAQSSLVVEISGLEHLRHQCLPLLFRHLAEKPNVVRLEVVTSFALHFSCQSTFQMKPTPSTFNSEASKIIQTGDARLTPFTELFSQSYVHSLLMKKK